MRVELQELGGHAVAEVQLFLCQVKHNQLLQRKNDPGSLTNYCSCCK